MVLDLLCVPSMFHMVLGLLSCNDPIFIRFRSLLLMKLSVAPESTCYVFLTYYCAHNGLPLGPSLYFVIRSYHTQTMTHTPPIADLQTMTHTPPIADLQTMTHTPPSDDSLLVHLLVVPVACDSD
jgi:hypothetical protein